MSPFCFSKCGFDEEIFDSIINKLDNQNLVSNYSENEFNRLNREFQDKSSLNLSLDYWNHD